MGETLQDFIEEVNGDSHLRVEHDFGDGFVRLKISEAERRQAAQDIQNSENIILEMLRNSRDAHASHVFVAMNKEGGKRTLTVIDDGCGIPESMHDHVFEPRVTSKLDTSHMDTWGMHGRGMALYSIAANAESAKVMQSAPDKGCSICVVTDTTKLSEKVDQSTFPTFTMEETGKVNVRGPKNLLRTVCEFAIDSRANCTVYIGSPVDIAATLYAYGSATLAAIDRLFCKDEHELPVTKRLATAADPASFAEIAADLGLLLSERTARRILDGEIDDVDPVLDRVVIERTQSGGQRPQKVTKRAADARGLKLHADDVALLKDAVAGAFAEVSEKYFLEDAVTPKLIVRKDRITISVPVVHKP